MPEMDALKTIQARLEARARALAVNPDEGNTESGQRLSVVPFMLSGEQYGIELSIVSQVAPLMNCVDIPGTPDFILGMMLLEGELVSVTDLKPLFQLPSTGITNFDKILVLQQTDMRFALMVNEVLNVREIDLDSLQPLEQWHGADARFIRGVTPDRLILLNGSLILSDPAFRVNNSPTNPNTPSRHD